MSNENQTPTTTSNTATQSDKVSPFLSSPLPEGTPQGQKMRSNLLKATINIRFQKVQIKMNRLEKPHILVLKLYAQKKKSKKSLMFFILLQKNMTS